jgi:hypothetical protein
MKYSASGKLSGILKALKLIAREEFNLLADAMGSVFGIRFMNHCFYIL